MDELNNQSSNNSQILPALPGSDPASIARNSFHGFYNIGSRDYWKYNTTSLSKLQDKAPCEHFFLRENYNEVRCQRCYVGLAGPEVTAQDGKLLFRNEPVVF